MINKEIQEELFKLQDVEYREFQSKLIPTVNKDSVIGIRLPELRKYAKVLVKDERIQEFLDDLPHKYYDEMQLHAFVVSEIKDMGKCISEIEKLLPYIDNWATCDTLIPKVFKKHKEELLEYIKKWIIFDDTYTIRFAVSMLMKNYLDEGFKKEYSDMVMAIKSDEYYVNMMRAWYFATALAKQYDYIIPYIEKKKLDVWTHNKTIQKAVESYRITNEQKEYLRSLKVKLK